MACNQKWLRPYGGWEKRTRTRSNEKGYENNPKVHVTMKKYLKVSTKIKAINLFKVNRNKKETARIFRVHPQQIRTWIRNEEKLRAKALINSKARSLHKGRPLAGKYFEPDVISWLHQMRSVDVPVNTKLVVSKIGSIDPLFLQLLSKHSRFKYVYRMLRRYDLAIRRPTHKGQRITGHMEEVIQKFQNEVLFNVSPEGPLAQVKSRYIVNMDQTRINFEPEIRSTIEKRGQQTISVRSTGSNSHSLTAFLAVAADGTKLPPFLIFKAKAGAHIEKKIPSIVPDGVFGCCQSKSWADERGMKIWVRDVWQPYVRNASCSYLIIDEFRCHVQESFVDLLGSMGTDINIIPGGYTCRLQVLDVGINKPIKNFIDQRYVEWAAENLSQLPDGETVPAPSRELISKWLNDAWVALPDTTIRRTFARVFGQDISNRT